MFGNKGSSLHCQAIIRQFLKRGHDVTVFAARIGANDLAARGGIPAYCLADSLDRDTCRREKQLLDLNRRIADELSAHGPFQYIYERHSLWSYASMEYAQQHGAIGVLEVNAPLIEEQRQYRKLHFERAAQLARRRSFNAASTIVAVSRQLAEQLRHLTDDPEKIRPIANGVDTDRFAERMARTPTSANPLAIGFVGSFKPWHGVHVLLDAFADLRHRRPQLELWMIGDGPERERMQEKAASFSPEIRDAIRWPGRVDWRDMPSVLQQLDIAVAPYPPLDQFYFSPLKVMEYMAAGLPVVASDTGQIGDILRNDVNALLVPPGCVPSLSQQLERLVDDVDLRRRLGQSARRWVREHGDWTAVFDRIMSSTELVTGGR